MFGKVDTRETYQSPGRRRSLSHPRRQSHQRFSGPPVAGALGASSSFISKSPAKPQPSEAPVPPALERAARELGGERWRRPGPPERPLGGRGGDGLERVRMVAMATKRGGRRWSSGGFDRASANPAPAMRAVCGRWWKERKKRWAPAQPRLERKRPVRRRDPSATRGGSWDRARLDIYTPAAAPQPLRSKIQRETKRNPQSTKP